MNKTTMYILLIIIFYLLTFSSPVFWFLNMCLFVIIGIKQNKKALLGSVMASIILIVLFAIVFVTEIDTVLLMFNPLFNTVSRVYEIFDMIQKQVNMWITTLISCVLLLLPPVFGIVTFKIKK